MSSDDSNGSEPGVAATHEPGAGAAVEALRDPKLRHLRRAKRAVAWPVKVALRNHPELLDRLYFSSVRMNRALALRIGLVRPEPVWPPPEFAPAPPDTLPPNKGEAPAAAPRPPLPFGVNVAGHLAGQFGIAEASRALVHALRVADVPVSLNNLTDPNHRHNDKSLHGFSKERPYAVNLLAVNADAIPTVFPDLGAEHFRDRYNIAVWYWELPRFPESFLSRCDLFDEIWVTSAFAAEAIGKVSPIPVVKLTYPMTLDETLIQPNRRRLDIADDVYAFVFSFDFHSYVERKNPFAVFEAFRQAFGGDPNVLLVLKSINSAYHPDKLSQVEQAAQGLNVRLIDRHLSRGETLSLFAACDCYVSLHRSEGLGLGMAEAMYLGKPVIGTGWSGNLDFMNVNNSFLVKYRLIELDKDHGVYEKGNVWADADVDHAAELMRSVYENREAARRVGQRAAQDIKTRMNPQVTGQEMRERLLRCTSA